MIWSENKVIYSRCRFKKLNRREFQYSDLFISNEFRAELILKNSTGTREHLMIKILRLHYFKMTCNNNATSYI